MIPYKPKKKNMTYPQAFRFHKLPALGDADKDKRINVFDCRPYDKTRQHIKPNIAMQQRINRLPIYFTASHADVEDLERGIKAYHITDKNPPASIKKAITRFYSMVKKRPEVIGEIERKRPNKVIFTTKGSQYYDMYGETIEDWTNERGSVVVVRLTSTGRGYPYRRDDIETSAGTTIHELEHVRQSKAWAGKPKLQKRMRKGSWEERPEEFLAQEAEEKAARKRYTWPSQKKYAKDVRASFEKFEE